MATVQIEKINDIYKLIASYNNIDFIYYDGKIIVNDNNNLIAHTSYEENAEKFNKDLNNPYDIPENPILYAAIALRKGLWETIPNCKIYGTIDNWALTQLRKITRSLPCSFPIEYKNL